MTQAEIATLLPEVVRRTATPGSPLAALLHVMEAQHAPSEAALATLDRYFDPYRAPAHFIPFLARWVDLEWVLGSRAAADPAGAFPSGLGRLRDLIASATDLARWRGTSRGLIRFLEVATGLDGFRVEEAPLGEDGRPRPFHLLVHSPPGAERYAALIRRIVDTEKPAYVTWEWAAAAAPDAPAPGASARSTGTPDESLT